MLVFLPLFHGLPILLNYSYLEQVGGGSTFSFVAVSETMNLPFKTSQQLQAQWQVLRTYLISELPFLLSYIHCKNALEREPKLEELPISLLTWMSRSNPDLRYNLSRLDILAYESPVGIWYLGIQCKSNYLIA